MLNFSRRRLISWYLVSWSCVNILVRVTCAFLRELSDQSLNKNLSAFRNCSCM